MAASYVMSGPLSGTSFRGPCSETITFGDSVALHDDSRVSNDRSDHLPAFPKPVNQRALKAIYYGSTISNSKYGPISTAVAVKCADYHYPFDKLPW